MFVLVLVNANFWQKYSKYHNIKDGVPV